MVITLDNIRILQENVSVVPRVRTAKHKVKYRYFGLFTISRWCREYELLTTLEFLLSDGSLLIVPKGFRWDLSSVPRLFWPIFPPDGDFEVAALIHDKLYRIKDRPRHRSDVEMFTWSKAVAGTEGRRAWSDADNWVRYAFVRAFGWWTYYRERL